MAVRSIPSDIHLTLERRRRDNEDGEGHAEERAAIDGCRDIVSFQGNASTRQAFEAILAAEEEEHPDDWLSFLEELGVQAPGRR